MADRISSEHRSWNMSRIRNRNTSIELKVRSELHRMGYRFRLHRRDLPGNPDIVLPKYKTVIFVHGCFWHRHPGCRYAYTPKSRMDFWQKKFEMNIRRDKNVQAQLVRAGWKVIVIWECEIKSEESVKAKISQLMHADLQALTQNNVHTKRRAQDC